ncbi:MAG: septum formation protein Maf [Deltaproteobacteria bacterium]|nr:septum formation protein Maf [Deltaproteobacteria bacterium]
MKPDFISDKNPLVLASASPRRRRLLEQINIPFLCIPSGEEEDYIKGKPSRVARFFAEKKAKAVYPDSGKRWVLGADTIVVCRDIILGKPVDYEDAVRMLDLLSDRRHKVISGFCLVDPHGKKAFLDHETTRVKMKALSPKEIDGYVKTGEPFGKAGGYAVQGIGSFMIERVSGSYSNVVGLPLCAVVRALINVGALERFPFPIEMGT